MAARCLAQIPSSWERDLGASSPRIRHLANAPQQGPGGCPSGRIDGTRGSRSLPARCRKLARELPRSGSGHVGSSPCRRRGDRLSIGIESAAADAPALAVRDVTGSQGPVQASLFVNVEALAADAAADIRAVPTALRDAISELTRQAGLGEEAIRLVREAWEVHGTGVAVTLVGEPGSRMRDELTPPVSLDAAFVSTVSKEIATRVRAAGVKAGIHSGAEAKALANDVLAPAALSLLRERLALYDAEVLITMGMGQAERASAIRFRDVGSLVQTARLSPDWDVAAQTADVRSENDLLVKCIEAIVELALRDQPAGRELLDAVAWSGLLAAAYAYLEATSRSEAVHHQVRPMAIEISELYEIDAVPDAEVTATSPGSAGIRVYNLDMSALHRARAEYDIAEVHSREGARQNHGPGSIRGHPGPYRRGSEGIFWSLRFRHHQCPPQPGRLGTRANQARVS